MSPTECVLLHYFDGTSSYLNGSANPSQVATLDLLDGASGNSIGSIHGSLLDSCSSSAALATLEILVPFERAASARRLRLRLQWTLAASWTITFVPGGGAASDSFPTFFYPPGFASSHNKQRYVADQTSYTAAFDSWLLNLRNLDPPEHPTPLQSREQLPDPEMFQSQTNDPWWLQFLPVAARGQVFVDTGFYTTGLFCMPPPSTGGCARLVLALAVGTNSGRGTWLNLVDLDSWQLLQPNGGHDSGDSVQHLLFFPLDLGSANDAERLPTWHVIAQAPRKVTAKGMTSLVSAPGSTGPHDMLVNQWNNAVRALQHGSPRQAGQPFLPLPILAVTPKPQTQGDDVIAAVYHFSAQARRVDDTQSWKSAQLSWDSSLTGSFLVGFDQHDVHMSFWLSGPTPFLNNNFETLLSPDLVLTGQVKPDDTPDYYPLQGWWSALSDVPATRGQIVDPTIVPRYWAATQQAAAGDVSTTIEVVNLQLPSPPDTSAFTRLGSLEFCFGGNPSTNASMRTATLHMRGSWSSTQRDLYPEIDLNIPVLMRMAPTGDATAAQVTARFDVANAAEAALQRESSAILVRTDDSSYAGFLRIRMLMQQGLNPVTEMQFSLDDSAAPPEVRAFYFNARPFTVAMIDGVVPDEQSGSRYAQWRSDDAEGPQWRMGIDTVDVLLPPQAVGEEMQRGNRFEGDPPASTTKVLRSRFSPPTRMTLRPGTSDRRYIPNPADLKQILRASDVRSLRTEMVYPLQIDFKTDEQLRPWIRIGDITQWLGEPAPNLPSKETLDVLSLADLFDSDLSRWVAETFAKTSRSVDPNTKGEDVIGNVLRMRSSQAAMWANYFARLGEYALYDPTREDQGLQLSDGLTFTIRGPGGGPAAAKVASAPASNPLPLLSATPNIQTDLSTAQKTASQEFFGVGGDWSAPAAGAIRGGILHTFEFPSELAAVLARPVSTTGTIQALTMSALGASGSMDAAFDEERTTFSVIVVEGQVDRIVKTRIGRIGVCWNVAKHVIVYERTTTRSAQFAAEQDPSLDGWPILRKTEEYVDILQPRRAFDDESSQSSNAAGPFVATTFLSRRIYVNGAWGRDLGADKGYELPLWNPDTDNTLYPKPVHVLEGDAAGADLSRHFNLHPEDLYFFSSTKQGAGADPNLWEQVLNVDTCILWSQAPVATPAHSVNDLLGDKNRRPAGSLGLPRRFTFRLQAEAPLNLLHTRGQTPMLSSVREAYLSRSGPAIQPPSATTAPPPGKTYPPGSQAIADMLAGRPTVGTVDATELMRRLRQKSETLLQRVAQGAACSPILDELSTFVADQLKLARSSLVAPWSHTPATDGLTSSLESTLQGLVARGNLATRALVQPWNDALAQISGTDAQAIASLKDLGKSLQDERSLLFDSAQGALSMPAELFKAASGTLSDVKTALASAEASIQAIDPLGQPSAAFAAAVQSARDALAAVQKGMAKVTAPQFAPMFGRVRDVLSLLDQGLTQVSALKDLLVASVSNAVKALVSAEVACVGRIIAALGQLQVVLDTAATAANPNQKLQAIEQKYDQAASGLLQVAAETAQAAQAALRKLVSLAAEDEETLLGWINARANEVATAVHGLLTSAQMAAVLSDLDSAVDAATTTLIDVAGQALDKLQDDAQALITSLNGECTALQQGLASLEQSVSGWAQEQADAVARSVSDYAGSELARRVEAFADTAVEAAADASVLLDAGSSAIKLSKAFADMPALPSLSFDISQGDFGFAEAEKQVRTSRFLARLADAEDALNDLGAKLGCESLLDQCLPISDAGAWADAKFKDMIAGIGGVVASAEQLFESFKIGQILPEEFVITSYVDPATRSGWAKVKLDKSFQGSTETVFSAGSLELAVQDARVTGEKDMSVVDGKMTQSGSGSLRADWLLNFAGQMAARFRDVDVTLDSQGHFHFNIDPKNLEFNPALQFISDIVNSLGTHVPPNIHLTRDSRGRPNGASASFLMPMPALPPMGNVQIGPFDISAGMALRVTDSGKFAISALCGMGSRERPVFVQFNALGGGFFIEADSTFNGSSPVSTATLGLSLGSQEHFDFAGVANGGYAFLFFASLAVSSQTGATFAVGVSVAGSARILGVANASVYLLLEVERGADGATKGHGELDVSVQICWCYTLNVHQYAEKPL